MEISSNTQILFDSFVTLKSITNYGNVSGILNFTGSFQNGDGAYFGTDSQVSNITINGNFSMTASSFMVTYIKNSLDYSNFVVTNAALGGTLTTYIFHEISPSQGVIVPVLTFSTQVGMFNSYIFINDPELANPFDCPPVINLNTDENRYFFTYLACTLIASDSSSPSVLGYNKTSLIYFGVAVAVIIVVVAIVAVVIRQYRIFREGRKRDFFSFKDEDFHKKYVSDLP